MIADREYSEAVSRLRVRECTEGDVELFNSRVVMSFENPDGIYMGTNMNKSATILVSTNASRETLNNQKAMSSCDRESLVRCAALDKIKGNVPELHVRQQLLKLNVSKMSHEHSLPGFILLFIGMPVVLWSRNISTELGVTNGCQCIVHHVVTDVCPAGLTYATCVIVEIPDSDIALRNLPKHHFPIVPITWKYTAAVKGNNGLVENPLTLWSLNKVYSCRTLPTSLLVYTSEPAV